ncbi:MAG: hypothetical protein H0T76_02360 [Nannocystis sp.]|nr:hypothetical protein [Nannocystis sp.]MBA3545304.1 hypothetical protein [Nannocystis sp.]
MTAIAVTAHSPAAVPTTIELSLLLIESKNPTGAPFSANRYPYYRAASYTGPASPSTRVDLLIARYRVGARSCG